MAIFVAFAWVIEAAEWLGFIEIECQEADSRAYRLAHQGLALLKEELSGGVLEVIDDQTVAVVTRDGGALLQCRDGTLWRRRGESLESLLCLGPGGGSCFVGLEPRGLEARIWARTEDGGAYDVTVTIPGS